MKTAHHAPAMATVPHAGGPRTRRRFLMATAALAAALTLNAAAGRPAATGDADMPENDRKKSVLFLGGTGWLGPEVVRRLVDAGHEVTLFNRGRRTDDLFPDLEFIEGNRIRGEEPGPGLANLESAVRDGRRWDWVIDTASVHTWTEDTVALLKDAADHYMVISSISVYDSEATPGAVESAPVHTMPDDVAERITRLPYDMQYYGAVKARMEEAARRGFGDGALIIRPGLIVGPGDMTGRFTYWPARLAEGGQVLAPGDGQDHVQVIDVRDLADWMAHCVEHDVGGTYNAVCDPVEMDEFLRDIKKGTGSDAELVWIPSEVLAMRGVHAWAELPAWVPNEGPYAGFGQRSNDAAERAGLRIRPLEETARDTLAWYRSLDDQRRAAARGGLDPEKEQDVVRAWTRSRDAG